MNADVRQHPHLLSMTPAKRHQFRGEWLTASEIAELTGIHRGVVYARLKRGQPVDVARRKPPRLYWYQGQQLTAKQVAEITGLSTSGVYLRTSGDRILDDGEMREQRERLSEPHPLAVMITYRGKTQTMTAWAAELGMGKSTFHVRYVMGWSMHRIANEPVMSASVRGTLLRNRRVIQRLTIGFRRIRNAQLIHRISTAFRTGSPQPPGYLQTSHRGLGTGVGSFAVERGHSKFHIENENRSEASR